MNVYHDTVSLCAFSVAVRAGAYELSHFGARARLCRFCTCYFSLMFSPRGQTATLTCAYCVDGGGLSHVWGVNVSLKHATSRKKTAGA